MGFQQGDFQRPHNHFYGERGAVAAGVFVVKAVKNSIKIRIEDPRGINPPYGKSLIVDDVLSGMLHLFPAWLGHMITPNLVNKTAICLSFVVRSKVPLPEDTFARMIVPE